MTVARTRTLWTGPQIVGNGVTDLYFFGSSGDEALMLTRVHDFWDTIKTYIALTNVASFDPNVVNIDETDGSVVSIVTVGSPPATVTGTASGDPLPPATQALVQWLTSGIVANRRVRGRTFIPAMTEANSTAGSPLAAMIAGINAAAVTYRTAGTVSPVIWSRPTPSRAGSFHTVSSSTVWNKFASLRSRRD